MRISETGMSEAEDRRIYDIVMVLATLKFDAVRCVYEWLALDGGRVAEDGWTKGVEQIMCS